MGISRDDVKRFDVVKNMANVTAWVTQATANTCSKLAPLSCGVYVTKNHVPPLFLPCHECAVFESATVV